MSENTTNSTVSTVSPQIVLDHLLSGDWSAWSGLSAKERNAVRRLVRDGMRNALRNADIATGQALLSVEKQMSESSAKSATPTIDPKVAIAQRVANLRMAADLLLNGQIAPDGVDTPVELTESDIPDGNREAAERYAKVPITRKRKENDIPTLIRAAFASHATGTFMKVSEIRRAIATIHPEKNVSAEWDGRLSAALFGPNGVEGLESVDRDHKAYSTHGNRKGAIKVESPVWDESDNTDEGDAE